VLALFFLLGSGHVGQIGRNNHDPWSSFGKGRTRKGDRPGPLDSVVDLQCIGETQGSFCGLQNGRLRKW
jgi:hypothetical protein